MKYVLLYCGKVIYRLFGYSWRDYRYFEAWKYIYGIGLQGMGREQGISIEKSGELDVIRKILKEFGSDIVIFDVGANKGQYSSHIIQEMPGSKKVSLHIFEPSRANIQILQNKFDSSKYPGHQFIVNPLALSDINANEYLYTDEQGSDLGSLLNLKLPIRPFDESKKELVETIKLDDYCIKNAVKAIDLLKIDVEGAEYKVLIGALEVINQKRIKHIQFEFGAGNITARIFFHDFWDLLSDKYHFFQVLSGGLIPIKEYNTDLEIFKTTNYLLILK
jgi:FkbM family methyltransferase